MLVSAITSNPYTDIGSIIGFSSEIWDQKATTAFGGNSFPYIEISKVGLGTDEYSVEETLVSEAPSRARMVVRADDILMSTTRPHRGAIAKIRLTDDGSIASTGFAVLRGLKTDVVDLDFLLNVLLSSLALRQFAQRSSGGNYPAIVPEEIGKVLVPVPVDLDVQRKMVAEMQAARIARQTALDEADVLMAGLDQYLLNQLRLSAPQEENRQSYALTLRKIRNNRCDALYYAPHFNQLEASLQACPYPKKTLGVIAPDPVGGATPSRSDASLYAEEGIKFLRILNVTPNELRLEDVKYIQDSVHQGELKRSQLQAEDVLMTITGRVGTAAVVTEEMLPANINQHIVRLRVQDDKCLASYLAAYLNCSVGLGLSNRNVTGGTRIALDYEAIKAIEIPVPPTLLQVVIVTEITKRYEKARDLRAQAATDWEAAKTRFERQLLGEEPLP